MNILEIIFNILIFINLYWYGLFGFMIPALYYIFTKFFAFPLASNRPHELIIMAKPEKIKIKKVTNRYLPFFVFKRGLYWFDTPCTDKNLKNQYHIYGEGINQNIINMERRKGKLEDILHNKTPIQQIGTHQIRIPKKLKMHFHKHYQLIIDMTTQENIAELIPVKDRQPFKINFYHSLGILIKNNSIEETEEPENIQSSNTSTQLISLSNQTVIQQINFVQEYNYFSANYAYTLWKHHIKVDKNFIRWISGAIDPMIILIIAGMGIAIAAIIFFNKSPEEVLGPMPE